MKKRLYIVLIVAVFLNKGYGQNLVQNGSFEDTISCPIVQGQYYNSVNWNAINSVDYYNYCSINLNPENNVFCNSVPYDGEGFMGLGQSIISSQDSIRELLFTSLISPTSKDSFYCLSSFVKASGIANYYSDGFHMALFKNPISISEVLNGNFNQYEKIKLNSILDDYYNWTELKGGFFSSEPMNFLYMGNLESGLGNLLLNNVYAGFFLENEIYFIVDNVSLFKLSLPVYSHTFTCESGQLSASVSGADSVRWYRNGQLFSQQPNILLPDIQTGEILIAEYFLCNYTFTDTVTVPPCTVPEPEFPNIITPNGDGVNDVFQIEQLAAGSTLAIYNRWGNEVFKTDNYDNNWHGETKTLGIETQVCDGTYFYVLVTPQGNIYKGSLTVVK